MAGEGDLGDPRPERPARRLESDPSVPGRLPQVRDLGHRLDEAEVAQEIEWLDAAFTDDVLQRLVSASGKETG